ncbi:MAG: WYL domain-containing protein [Fluviicola sp.]|nr:WYL domain-containing protein [Fluviicola sp.]
MLNQHKVLRVLQLISLLQQNPPKSIHHLAKVLDTTIRTAYRYVDLIRSLGFDLQKDTYNRYFITNTENEFAVNFSPEESEFLRQLVLSSGKNNQLKDTILKKIYLASETTIVGSNLLNAHLGRIVQDISEAIMQRFQVKLKNYHSLSGLSIRDRIVEPIAFTDNYRSLMAFEVDSQKNKYFNVERITNVEVLEKPWENEGKHNSSQPDPFGFAPNDQKFNVHLILSLKAYLLLKEEYPLCIPYLKSIPNSDKFELKLEVNNLKPIQRFVEGLKQEIEVLNLGF